MDAAEAAERVLGYVRLRGIGSAPSTYERVPEPERLAGMDLPQLYLRCLDALQTAGEQERFGALATGHTAASPIIPTRWSPRPCTCASRVTMGGFVG